MKKLIILLTLILSVGLSAQNIRDVDAETFKKLMEDKKSIVIDLRTPSEIKTKGKIKNAVELDFLALDAEENIKKLDKKKSYLIYCAGGGRSGDCKDLMVKEGFKNVVNLAKGFDDWKKKGLEVETVK
ncbi:MAG: rhodanese-like domain-containing protein [Bacteroidota bacterium]|nr:rhodanese-like domain-containing protein [Bacteroidota bacterium]